MPSGYLLLILHAHLPYVRHPEFDRFLEERWFFEAVTETYVPLIKFLDRLKAEGTPFKLTLSVSPPLANMMEDPLLRERCVRHFDTLVELAEREIDRTRQWHDVNFLATMYRNIFEDSRRTFVERCQTRLVSAFRELAESGHLELMTCAGTHGYLPLLNSEPATVRRRCWRPCTSMSGFSGRLRQGCGFRSAPSIPASTSFWPRRGCATSWSTRTRSSTPTHGRCSGSTPRCIAPPGWPPSGGIRRRPSSSGATRSATRPITTTASITATSASSSTRTTSNPTSTRGGSGRRWGSSTTGSPGRGRTSTCTTRTAPGTPPSAMRGTS